MLTGQQHLKLLSFDRLMVRKRVSPRSLAERTLFAVQYTQHSTQVTVWNVPSASLRYLCEHLTISPQSRTSHHTTTQAPHRDEHDNEYCRTKTTQLQPVGCVMCVSLSVFGSSFVACGDAGTPTAIGPTQQTTIATAR